MKIKVDVRTVARIIDPSVPMEKLYKQLKTLSANTGIFFGSPSVGAGTLLWTLEGDDWIAFSDLDDTTKAQAAAIFNEKRGRTIDSLNGSSLTDSIFTVPDSKYIFFRKLDSTPEVAITCWGYRYPNLKDGAELETWIKKLPKQKVIISFSWAGNKISDFPFKFNSYPRHTGLDGLFVVDQPLPVGSVYTLESMAGNNYELTVIQGKSDYDYDLTKYFSISITVEKDEVPLENQEINVTFANKTQRLNTDAMGKADLKLPLERDQYGDIKYPQSDCTVTCIDDSQSKTPKRADEVLEFKFNFKTPAVEESEVVKEPEVVLPPEKEVEKVVPPEKEFIGITILDYEKYPVKEMSVSLTFPDKRTAVFITDENGRIQFPKEWMSKKGKIKVKFVATPDYQQTHDLHNTKSKR